MGMHVVVIGSPFSKDGLAIYGPFATADEAVEWAEREYDEWEVVPLKAQE